MADGTPLKMDKKRLHQTPSKTKFWPPSLKKFRENHGTLAAAYTHTYKI
jgi:hypothetical protein